MPIETPLQLLHRLRGWDMLDGAADGPYWKRTIDEVLGANHAKRWCLCCGGEFSSEDKRVVYCCADCRIKASRDRKREALRTARGRTPICQGCGIEFKPTHARMVYCSRNCARRSRYSGKKNKTQAGAA